MADAFRLPELGEDVGDAEVLRWLAAEGDEVEAGAPLVEVHTDKATLEVPAPRGGTLLQVVAPAGAVVPVGGVLGVLGAAGEQLLYAVDAPAGRPEPRPRPLVEVVPEPPVALSRARRPSDETRLPVRGVRRAIVDQVTRAHREVPAVTFVEECDVSRVAYRLLPAVVAAVAAALREHAELNARLDGDAIVLLERVDVGVTVETDDGVVVPVVRGADALAADDLARELERLAAGARAGALAPDELRGSTFTVTVGGALGGLLMTPLVNHPEVAILAVHRPAERAVVRDGAIVARPVANVSVTFDHRVVDASAAAAFCLDVIGRLETAP